MPLSSREEDELRGLMANGHSASDAVPFIRRLAQSERIEEIPDAIAVAGSAMEVNRAMGRSFLAHRVPGILMNHYFRATLAPAEYRGLIEETLEDSMWSERVVDAAATGDGARLRDVVAELVNRARERVEKAE